MKLDAKFFIFIVAAVIVAKIVGSFLIKEKVALTGKIHKSVLTDPNVPAATDAGNANNPASPFNNVGSAQN